jgi:T-complex protein 1 subunit beta
MSSFVGAVAVSDMVKSTLGPKGMDKILQSTAAGNAVLVTNDGATILKSIDLDNPAAKILVNISKVQDDEVGDGTTSVCVLAGELLRQAERLVMQKIHPQVIIEGFREASTVALQALKDSAVDNSADEAKFREDLMNIARTTLSSKILGNHKDFFADMCVRAVSHLKGSTNLDSIQIIKKSGGLLSDSFLDDQGFLLDKSFGVGQPTTIKNAKVLIANTPMDTDKVKIFGARVRVDGMEKLSAIEQAEKEKMKKKCDKIIAHKCNVFINRQLIYNFPEQLFSDAGVSAIEHADFDGIERLSKVLGGDIVSTFDTPEKVTLGECALIEEFIVGEDKLIRFSGCKGGGACSVVLRGASDQLLDEAERSIHDALSVLSQTVSTEHRTVLGGGCSEVLMAVAVDELARKTSGKKALAIEGFSLALRALPTIIADNGGYDSTDLVAKIRAEHFKGNHTAGLDMKYGKVGDMRAMGITESYKLKSQVVSAASEAAEMILRVDDIIVCARRQREDHPHM